MYSNKSEYSRLGLFRTLLFLIIFIYLTSLVAWWSELLTTNHEVTGSIPVSTMCVFP